MNTVLVLAQEAPRGRSRIDLVPPLSPEQAAELQRALTLDTLAACRREAADVRLLYGDADETDALAALAPETPIVLQHGAGVADALRNAIERYSGQGAVAVVASDLPGLPAGALTETFRALDDHADVVLGPASDGGCWLIAMCAAHDAPFRDIPWSTPAVFEVARSRCQQAGLRVHTLERWRGSATWADLCMLPRELDRALSPSTARVVSDLAERGLIPDHHGVALTSSRLLASSPWRAVIDDQLEWPDGRATSYTYLAVPPAVFVVPVTDAGELVLVRQYRHPVRDWTLEVPAGSVNDGETPPEAAERELFEETGGRSTRWRHLATFYSSSAHLSLRSDAFLASGVALTTPDPDEGEEVSTVRMPVADALALAQRGGFPEGQTALAILLAGPLLDQTRAQDERWRTSSSAARAQRTIQTESRSPT